MRHPIRHAVLALLTLLALFPRLASARKPEPVVQTGHASRVTSARFSPDGRTIVTTSFDRTARLWDAATGKLLHILGHPYRANPAAFRG